MESCYKERIFYYWTHCLYGHVEFMCEKALEKKRNDIYLIIYQSLSKAIVGDIQQSLISLNAIQHRKDLSFLLSVSTYFIYKSSKKPNSAKIDELKEQIQKDNHDLSIFVVEFSSEIALLFNDYQMAEEIIKKSDKTIQTNSILGWVKMRKGQFEESDAIFNEILKDPNNSFHLLTLYGKGKLLYRLNQFSESIQFYARILSKFDFPEINFEKSLIYMNKGNWNFLDDLMTKTDQMLPTTIELDIFNFLSSFYRYENIKKAVESIKSIIQICQKIESKNWFLIATLAHAFGTIGCRNEEILFQSMKLSQIAVNANSESSYCLSVLGYHQIMNQRILIGQNSLYESLKYDSTNSFAEENLMRMNFECNKIDILKDELDLYLSMNEKNLFILLFITKVTRLLNEPNYNVFVELIEKVDENISMISNNFKINQHFSSEIQNSLFSNVDLPFMKFIGLTINLNFEIIFDCLDEILFYFEFPKIYFNDKIYSIINNVFKKVSNLIPGNTSLQFYKGCFLFIKKKYYQSLSILQSVLVSLYPFRISHVLMIIAGIYVQQNDTDLASQYLEEALKFDKMICNEILFKLIELNINPTQNKIDTNYDFVMDSFGKLSFINLLAFVDVFIQNEMYSKALNVLKLMIDKFDSKIVKELIVLRQAKIRAGRDGDLNRALFLLNQLKKHEKIHETVILTESEIYLNIFHNEQKYIQILRENCEMKKSQKKLEMLGDGYLRLKMFNEASEVYIKSIKKSKKDDPNSINLETIQKLMVSLIKCHRYNDSVLVFNDVILQIKSDKQIVISLLFQIIKIDRFDDVKKCIASISGLFSNINTNSISNCSLVDADFLGIKACFLRKNGDLAEAAESYEKSIEIYEEIFKSRKKTVYLTAKKEIASELCVQAGGFYENYHRKDKAFEFYKLAYKIMPTNQNALVMLVDYYKQRDEINKCVEICEKFIKIDPYNENAVLLYTSYQNVELNKSIIVMKKFLTKKPHCYRVIVRMVEVCFRSGVKNQLIAKKYLTADKESGMVFARGVFDFYRGNIESAFNSFEILKNDRKWGLPAKLCMIELYLNPNRKYIWEDQQPLSTEEKYQKAKILIDQIYSQKVSDDDQVSIEKEMMLAELEKSTNTESSVSIAVSKYQTILSKIENASITSLSSSLFVQVLVGLASCYMRLSRQKEAVQLIDRLIKPMQSQIPLNREDDSSILQPPKPSHETSSYYEEAYLMRAHVLMCSITAGSQQAALHYVYLALDLNQNSRKGWEICAESYMKSGMFADAANALKNCWLIKRARLDAARLKIDEIENENMTDVGYLYAETALKAKKPEDALEMCRELLHINPCFNGLREKIIIPAFKMLKQ